MNADRRRAARKRLEDVTVTRERIPSPEQSRTFNYHAQSDLLLALDAIRRVEVVCNAPGVMSREQAQKVRTAIDGGERDGSPVEPASVGDDEREALARAIYAGFGWTKWPLDGSDVDRDADEVAARYYKAADVVFAAGFHRAKPQADHAALIEEARDLAVDVRRDLREWTYDDVVKAKQTIGLLADALEGKETQQHE